MTDNEENFVDEGAEDFKPPEPQSKSEARGIYLRQVHTLQFIRKNMHVLESVKTGRFTFLIFSHFRRFSSLHDLCCKSNIYSQTVKLFQKYNQTQAESNSHDTYVILKTRDQFKLNLAKQRSWKFILSSGEVPKNVYKISITITIITFPII